MIRRRSVCAVVAVLVGSMGLAFAPVAAQASEPPPPEWILGRNHLLSTPVGALFFGEVTLTSPTLGGPGKDEIHCKDIISGSAWNEGGIPLSEVVVGPGEGDALTKPRGATGMGEMEGWGTAACKAPGLEKGLEEQFKKQIEEGLIKPPITVYATAELPLEEQTREAEVCKEGAASNQLKTCIEHGETEIKPEITSVRRRGPSLPWRSELVRGIRGEEHEQAVINKIGMSPEGKTCYPKETVVVEENGTPKTVERPASWTQVPSGCIKITVVAPQIPDEIVFYGTLEPQISNGTKNGLFPSDLFFSTEAGTLISGEGGDEATSSGELSFLGEGVRLLTAQ